MWFKWFLLTLFVVRTALTTATGSSVEERITGFLLNGFTALGIAHYVLEVV